VPRSASWRRCCEPREVPNPLNPPTGCTFHPRCPHANDRCKAQRPALLEIGGVKIACHAVEEGRI
ncbi:MAG: oligopeptide/dipeptide ABC transporter ATP-binding protein, partial [Burkholderiaceae bacterium]